MFHAFIWLSEKNKRISGRKKTKKTCIVQNVEIESFGYFFTEINVFVITQRVKYRKKVPLGTGTGSKVKLITKHQWLVHMGSVISGTYKTVEQRWNTIFKYMNYVPIVVATDLEVHFLF